MGAGASVTDASAGTGTPTGTPTGTATGTPTGTPTGALISLALAAEMAKPLDASDVWTGTASTSAFAAKAEVARLRRLLDDPVQELGAGKVQINYQMYDEKFDIADGSMAVEKLDDEYALSFAMPGCKLELITCPVSRKHELENNPATADQVPFVSKSDDGTHFVGMHTLAQYWVVVYEDEEQRKRDMEKVRARIAADGIAQNEGEREVGCSCIEGNPCSDGNKYNCKNWEMRFQIAKENGWKGH